MLHVGVVLARGRQEQWIHIAIECGQVLDLQHRRTATDPHKLGLEPLVFDDFAHSKALLVNLQTVEGLDAGQLPARGWLCTRCPLLRGCLRAHMHVRSAQGLSKLEDDLFGPYLTEGGVGLSIVSTARFMPANLHKPVLRQRVNGGMDSLVCDRVESFDQISQLEISQRLESLRRRQ